MRVKTHEEAVTENIRQDIRCKSEDVVPRALRRSIKSEGTAGIVSVVNPHVLPPH
jgi:hypothetical protein